MVLRVWRWVWAVGFVALGVGSGVVAVFAVVAEQVGRRLGDKTVRSVVVVVGVGIEVVDVECAPAAAGPWLEDM